MFSHFCSLEGGQPTHRSSLQIRQWSRSDSTEVSTLRWDFILTSGCALTMTASTTSERPTHNTHQESSPHDDSSSSNKEGQNTVSDCATVQSRERESFPPPQSQQQATAPKRCQQHTNVKHTGYDCTQPLETSDNNQQQQQPQGTSH